jgi:hypothetical protein
MSDPDNTSAVRTHRSTVATAEMVRQVAIASASSSATKTAELAFFRTARASAISNGQSPHQFIMALQEMGTGGV